MILYNSKGTETPSKQIPKRLTNTTLHIINYNYYKYLLGVFDMMRYI